MSRLKRSFSAACSEPQPSHSAMQTQNRIKRAKAGSMKTQASPDWRRQLSGESPGESAPEGVMARHLQQKTGPFPMHRRQAAFTLVEIMIVVAIIADLSLIAMPAFMRARDSAQNARFTS